jgi:hypothetical protein
LGAITLVSCNEDDDTTGSNLDKPVVSISSVTNITLEEGESTTVTFTSNEISNQAMNFNLYPVTATANLEEDYSVGVPTAADWGPIGYRVDFPAFATELTLDVTTIQDLLPEDTEIVSFELRPTQNRIGVVNPSASKLDLTITNYVTTTPNQAEFIFEWEKDIFVEVAGGFFPACPNTDFDVYLVDANLWDINNPCVDYDGPCPGFYNLGYAMATGNCPESMTFTAGDIPDGDYVFVMHHYENGFLGFANETLPVTATIAKPGLLYVQYTQTDEESYKVDQPGYTNVGGIDPLTYTEILKFSVNGDNFKVSTLDDTVLGEG